MIAMHDNWYLMRHPSCMRSERERSQSVARGYRPSWAVLDNDTWRHTVVRAPTSRSAHLTSFRRPPFPFLSAAASGCPGCVGAGLTLARLSPPLSRMAPLSGRADGREGGSWCGVSASAKGRTQQGEDATPFALPPGPAASNLRLVENPANNLPSRFKRVKHHGRPASPAPQARLLARGRYAHRRHRFRREAV